MSCSSNIITQKQKAPVTTWQRSAISALPTGAAKLDQ